MSIAALFYRPRRNAVLPHFEVQVLIPAHNEAAQIESCVTSLLAQNYPRSLYRVTVIADNCTDETAEVARRSGADAVMERTAPESRGKGQALLWATDRILGGEHPPDAFVIVDADSLADPEMLSHLTAELAAGASVVQADYALEPGAAPGSELRAAAFLLVNRVRQAGRSVLGQTAILVGNGMLFSADVLRRHPWSAFSSTEDLEYSVDLALARVHIAFAGAARVTSETAPSRAAARAQQQRWEGGSFHLARARSRELLVTAVKERRLGLVGVVVELLTPPLALLGGGVIVGLIASTPAALSTRSVRPARPWLVAAGMLNGYVLTGLAVAGAPRSVWRSLAGAPGLILRKPVDLMGVLRHRPDSWERTVRASEMPAEARR